MQLFRLSHSVSVPSAVLSLPWFDESFSLTRVAGVLLIMTGIYLITVRKGQ